MRKTGKATEKDIFPLCSPLNGIVTHAGYSKYVIKESKMAVADFLENF